MKLIPAFRGNDEPSFLSWQRLWKSIGQGTWMAVVGSFCVAESIDIWVNDHGDSRCATVARQYGEHRIGVGFVHHSLLSHTAERYQGIVQLIGITNGGGALGAHALNGISADAAHFRCIFDAQMAPCADRARASLFGRNIVKKDIGIGSEDFRTQRRGLSQIACGNL
jgi:hypothetical protein